jgi:hypothetical protein
MSRVHTVRVLRGTRFPQKDAREVHGLRLAYVDVLEIEWPNGESDVMQRCLRADGTYGPFDDPTFWLRHAYQNYETAVAMTRASEERTGRLSGEPVEIVKPGHPTREIGPGDPAEWGRG